MKLIDKDAVVAEIKGLIRANELYLSEPKTDEIRFQKVGAYSVLNDLLHFLDTLEVKEMSNIWHTISNRDVDLPKAGDIICFIKNGRVISGEYRLNKFYGKVNNGYDNPIEKGDKWCFLSDILNSVVEVKEVDLEKSISDWLSEGLPNDEEEIDYIKETAKHFFELGLNAQHSSIGIPNIDDIFEEDGIDPNSKDAKIFKECYYMALEKLQAQK